jgi:hypothetical protein
MKKRLLRRLLKILRGLLRRPRTPINDEIAATRAAIAATETQITQTHDQLDSLTIILADLSDALDELEDSAVPVPPAIDPADIIFRADENAPFAEHENYTAQAINKYIEAGEVPENGIHGNPLPNGETLRYGKVADPRNAGRKALCCQVRNSDPTTSNGKRVELRVVNNIEMDKVYWIAVAAYVYDWGTLSTEDDALFATQMHAHADYSPGSPSFGIYTTQTGRTFRVQCQYSTASNPTSDNMQSVKFAEHDLPFGKWLYFVLKFRHNVSGHGFLYAWWDGREIARHEGHLGYNTGSDKYYAKFGYYNWSNGAMNSAVRKVLLRSPVIVRDPTGATYSEPQLRALLD